MNSNKPIRIISPQFELLAEIDNYESLQLTRRFYEVGEFELHININKQHTDTLVKDNLIMLENKANKVGIIMHRENQVGDNGEDTLIIKGVTLKGLAQRRQIVPAVNGDGYTSYAGSQETIMKGFVNSEMVNPTDANRKISQVSIAADQQRGIQDKWRSRFEVLSDKLSEIGKYAELGWDITLDIENKTWPFDVIKGRQLTVDQDSLPPVIFSTDFDNITEPHFIQSLIGCYNVAYAGGAGDDVDRLIQQVGSASGLDRLETFLDCSDADTVEDLIAQGAQQLADLAEIQTFEFGIIPDNTFQYEVDYDLGDYVTAQSKKWGITMNAQIIELTEVYETGGFTLTATFGSNIPTLLTILKKKLKKAVR